jgi:hypothetical protein
MAMAVAIMVLKLLNWSIEIADLKRDHKQEHTSGREPAQ